MTDLDRAHQNDEAPSRFTPNIWQQWVSEATLVLLDSLRGTYLALGLLCAACQGESGDIQIGTEGVGTTAPCAPQALIPKDGPDVLATSLAPVRRPWMEFLDPDKGGYWLSRYDPNYPPNALLTSPEAKDYISRYTRQNLLLPRPQMWPTLPDTRKPIKIVLAPSFGLFFSPTQPIALEADLLRGRETLLGEFGSSLEALARGQAVLAPSNLMRESKPGEVPDAILTHAARSVDALAQVLGFDGQPLAGGAFVFQVFRILDAGRPVYIYSIAPPATFDTIGLRTLYVLGGRGKEPDVKATLVAFYRIEGGLAAWGSRNGERGPYVYIVPPGVSVQKPYTEVDYILEHLQNYASYARSKQVTVYLLSPNNPQARYPIVLRPGLQPKAPELFHLYQVLRSYKHQKWDQFIRRLDPRVAQVLQTKHPEVWARLDDPMLPHSGIAFEARMAAEADAMRSQLLDAHGGQYPWMDAMFSSNREMDPPPRLAPSPLATEIFIPKPGDDWSLDASWGL